MSFPLAPMDMPIRVLTALVLALPAVFIASSIAGMQVVLVPTAVCVAGMYVWVWCWMRPTRFDVDERHLAIVFPWRRIEVPRTDIVSTRVITRAEFRAEHGFAARIGAGGLWGGFGLLWTRKRMYMLYVSRIDRMLIVERREGRWLLLTPGDLEGIQAALAEDSA